MINGGDLYGSILANPLGCPADGGDRAATLFERSTTLRERTLGMGQGGGLTPLHPIGAQRLRHLSSC